MRRYGVNNSTAGIIIIIIKLTLASTMISLPLSLSKILTEETTPTPEEFPSIKGWNDERHSVTVN